MASFCNKISKPDIWCGRNKTFPIFSDKWNFPDKVPVLPELPVGSRPTGQKSMKLWCFLNNGFLPDILWVQTVFTGTLTEHWLLSVDGGTKLLLQRGFLMLIFFNCAVNSHMCPRCSVSVNMSRLQFNKKLLLSNLSFKDITLHSWCWTTKTPGFHLSGSLLLHSGPNHPFHSLPLLQGGLLSVCHYDYRQISH